MDRKKLSMQPKRNRLRAPRRYAPGDVVRLFTERAPTARSVGAALAAAAEISDAPRRFHSVLVTNRIVRGFEIEPEGMRMEEFVERGMPLLYEHGCAGVADRIGNLVDVPKWTGVVGPHGLRRLVGEVQLAPPGVSPEADALALRMAAGIGSSVSIGFSILKLRSLTRKEKGEAVQRGENIDGYTRSSIRERLTDSSLIELSVVSLGADASARLGTPVEVRDRHPESTSFRAPRRSRSKGHDEFDPLENALRNLFGS